MTEQKAVIFDMDGVIVDSEKLWKQAEMEVFSSLGVQLEEEWTEITKTMTTQEVTKFWYDRFPWDNPDPITVEQQVISRVVHLIQEENCCVAGIGEFIKILKGKKYKIGLATNSPYRIIATVLKKAGVAHLFDNITSAEFESEGKPNPAVYFTSARNLGVNPKNCIAIEDSLSGILAARSAGMRVIAFTNGAAHVHVDLADFSILSFEEPLPKLFD
ncbi:MAG: hexitol phosphatase HxpB [Sphingobacterium sp.]